MKLYQYPNCSTCRKAIKWLQAAGHDFESIDITLQPPSVNELASMLASYDGDLRKLFNTSGLQYRELNMKEVLPTLSQAEALNLLADNGKLIKRPFLLFGQTLDDRQGVVGFKQAEWESLL